MRAAPAPSEARSLRLARRRRRVTAWPPHGLCLSASAFPGPACRAAHRLLPAARRGRRARLGAGGVPGRCAARSAAVGRGRGRGGQNGGRALVQHSAHSAGAVGRQHGRPARGADFGRTEGAGGEGEGMPVEGFAWP
jgi:hypothetical protein